MSEATTSASLVSDEMRAAVGREFGRSVSYPVSVSDIRRWALAVYYPARPPRLYWDAEYAAATEHGGIVAPLEFNPFAWLSAEPGFRDERDGGDPDSVEKILGIPGSGLTHQLNGGITAKYGVRMRPGDVITAVHRLGDYSSRTGRLGPMLFTIFTDEWRNQRGELVKRSTNTLIRY